VDPIPLEARQYQGRRAGVVTRAAAFAVDAAVAAGILGLLYVGWCVLAFVDPRGSYQQPRPEEWAVVVAAYVVTAVYLAMSWRISGRSLGCHVMGIRVVGRHGRPPGRLVAWLRAAFCVVFPLGFFWVLVSRDNRSVQDVVLRTSVVYDWDVRPGAGVAASRRHDDTPAPGA
jgi:uncharacterized RDD family membrane protein YckC